MRTLSVKDFERLQHYKDRNPPWIKLYNAVLDDYAFAVLPDAAKFHLIAISLLASRTDNRVPYDPRWIEARIAAQVPVDLAALIAAGFLRVNAAASTALDQSREEKSRDSEASASDAGASGRALASSDSSPGKPPPAEPPTDCDEPRRTDLKGKLFGECLSWLAQATSRPADRLRAGVGRWCKEHGDGAVLEAFIAARRESPIDPLAWITATLKRRGNHGRRDHTAVRRRALAAAFADCFENNAQEHRADRAEGAGGEARADAGDLARP